MSLTNLASRQSESGDRAAALASITEAVRIRRTLVEQNPAAFLPDLAMSLHTLSVLQSETGDRAGALTSITEAVSTYRTLAEQNPAAFLPNLTGSLNNLSVLQSETGDRAGALTSITDAVSAYRTLAILRLTEHVRAGEVFDAILDPTDARQLLLRVARTGSAELIAEAWYATPHVAADPFAATLAVALVQALSDEAGYPDEINQALPAAAATASTSERRDTLTLLRALATTRDDRAEQLHRIATAIAPTGERSD